jgi:hypothetical protein
MRSFPSDDSQEPDTYKALVNGTRLKRLVRAAGNIRILLLGWPVNDGKPKGTRPVATGTFSYPAFGPN